MAYNTNNPIGSTDARDLDDNAENLDYAVNSDNPTWTDRLGVTKPTLQAKLDQLGFDVPVVYESGIEFTELSDRTKTVEEGGVVYAPLQSEMPFTTTGTWGVIGVSGDNLKFFTIQSKVTPENIGDYALTPSNASDYTIINFDTVANAQAGTLPNGESVTLKSGDVIRIEERGGGLFKGVLSATPNGFNILDFSSKFGIYFELIIENRILNIIHWGAKGTSTWTGTKFDDTPAVAAAVAYSTVGDTVYFPTCKGYWNVGDVEFKSYTNVIGECPVRIYNPITDPSVFEGLGAIIWNQDYTDPVSFQSRIKARDLILHGVDKTKNGVSNSGSVSNLFFDRVSFSGYNRGIGTTNTINNSRLFNCHASQNDKGVMNLVDSHSVDGEYNDNRVNVDSQTGANDTVFLGTKNEWAEEENWNFYESTNNVVIGGVCDRAGYAGFKIRNAEVQIVGVKTRRSGRYILGQANCSHYDIGGSACKVIISAPSTKTGYDDGGGGDLTPNYSISTTGADVGTLIVNGGDLSGFVTSAYNKDVSVTEEIFTSVTGVEERVNTGNFKKIDGKRLINKPSRVTLAPSETASFVLTDTPIKEYTRDIRELYIYSRDQTSGSSTAGKTAFIRRREVGTSVVYLPTIMEDHLDRIGTTSSAYFQYEVTSINSDFSEYTITVTNNSLTNTQQLNIEIN